ncbi:cytadherence high molecular weight protein 2 [Papilio machaon]|uniref:cytadherence high molecular weight protein 2 n=1 Tax=Papilio machaon TaxID=76193 RepID=UPI001E664545|nr:cytadherence high molecular weight protein 2 [Papilio machaon]
MSFISKRERVFNEYDLVDLPSRNEGKLKAYSSCTDARAWSHFCSDKSDHLVEIIKRNNDTCRPKYIPTDVIVNTLMVTKNTEINRLRRKIEEFEQLLAAYDQLELTNDQKNEIANAHAAIKAANKQLDDMCLDLDLSGFTEGIDSETFETGKSRGDEIMRFPDFETSSSIATERSVDKSFYPSKETQTQGDQSGPLTCPCDASTVVHDPRIEEMKDTIIRKDAKLNAMRNTIAVMENDVCEPYCIYAHIYTALEKIFGTLCQNEKYKHYLDLLTSGKDTRNIDIKGKIFYKLKVLEKFCCALISPCSKECSCYHTEIISRVETAFAVTTQGNFEINIDSKRAHLVADIIGNDEMKEILSKSNTSGEEEEALANETLFINNCCSIEVQNLHRLKNLQACYDELLLCYDELKYEKNCLTQKCLKYDELEKEYETLKNKLNSYNMLLTEKEYYKKRSEDLDDLKEKFIVLADETCTLETQLRAQTEIIDSKSSMLEQIRSENISLQNKLSESSTDWEKEKHSLICKLKENECKIMCQDQQIDTLTVEINKFLRKNKDNAERESQYEVEELIQQINLLKQEVKNLKDTLYYKEEESNQIKNEFHEKLMIGNLEIEKWKELNEKMNKRNEKLETLMFELQDCVKNLTNENQELLNERKDLKDELINKCLETKSLMMEADSIRQENSNLVNQLQEMNQLFNDKIQELESEKKEALNSLNLASKESKLLLDTISSYEKLSVNSEKIDENLQICVKKSDEKDMRTLDNQNNGSDVLLNEIDKFVALNTEGIKNLISRSRESIKYLEEKDNEALESKLREIDELKENLKASQNLYENLEIEKNVLLNKLQEKTIELDKADIQIKVLKEQKEYFTTVLEENKKMKEELIMIKHRNDVMFDENINLKNDLLLKNHEIQNQLKTLAKMKIEKKHFISLSERVKTLEQNYFNLCREYDNLLLEKDNIESQISRQTQSLQTENINTKSTLNAIIEENNILANKINSKAALETDHEELKIAYNEIKKENENLELELQSKSILMQNLEIRNQELQEATNNLMAYNENIEDTLIRAREELQLQVKVSNSLQVVDIKNEVEKIKKENYYNLNRIQELLNELKESDQTTANLRKKIADRDDKIAILENQVNELGDEVQRLQTSLATMLDIGENRDIRNHEIDQSLKLMEAHHSKATHNMKIELAKLKDQNLQLEEKLSTTIIEVETSAKENESRLSGEIEIIATDIKQLEIKCVGDSALSPDNCSLKSIMTSLERIDDYIETRNNSCHLVLTKADEAKKIVEKEKQKIYKEKEEAIKEKIDAQKELSVLKKSLENQLSKDKSVINDLEAELLNQKLLIDKLKQSVRIYILKLEEEICSMQDMYTTALDKINELEAQLEGANKDKKEKEEIIKKVRLEVKEKSQDIKSLRSVLDALKNKKAFDFAAQTQLQNNLTSISTQTEKLDLNEIDSSYLPETTMNNKIIGGFEEGRVLDKRSDDCMVPKSDKKESPLLTNVQPDINEVQILATNVEPTLGFVKNAYVHYKIKKLSFTAMEQYSVSCISNEDTLDSVSKQSCHVNEMNSSPINNVTALEMASKGSSYKIADNDLTSFSLISNMESDKIRIGTPNVAKVKKTSIDNIFAITSESNEMNLSLTHSNIVTNKDFIIIYRDSDCENESKINTDIPREKTRFSESVYKTVSREIILPQNDYYSAKVISDTKSFKENKYSTENALKSLTDEAKSTLLASKPVYSHISLSETTFIKDLAVENKVRKAEQKNGINGSKGIDSRLSHSFTSLKLYRENCEPIEMKENHKEEIIFNSVPKTKIDLYLYKQNMLDRNSNLHNGNIKINDSVDTTSQLDIRKGDNAFGQSIEYTTNTLNKIGIENKTDVKGDRELTNTEIFKEFLKRTYSNEQLKKPYAFTNIPIIEKHSNLLIGIPKDLNIKSSKNVTNVDHIKTKDVSVMVQFDNQQEKIKLLTSTLENIDRSYKEKIRAIKAQYDNNIKNIMNEHNQGVQSLQSLHEETLQDILKVHENETENLRSMSIDAMRKVDRLEKENKILRAKIILSSNVNKDMANVSSIDVNTQNLKKNSNYEIKTLTKTDVEEFNYNPKAKIHGPCTCSLDVNISDTIRNIFEQVDVEQRKIAEQAYLRYIANKILTENIEALDAQELSFLHFKICRTWKSILRKEEVLSKRIDCLENEVINKQRQRNKHIAEIDRKVAEERRRLQEVREAVCRDSFEVPSSPPQPTRSQDPSMLSYESNAPRSPVNSYNVSIDERLPAGDLAPGLPCSELRYRNSNRESQRTISGKGEERREKKLYCDEKPTRLRRTTDRPNPRAHKK